MVDKFIKVPVNLEDPLILKRFLTELVDKLNGNALISYPIMYPSGYSGPINYEYASSVGQYTNTILEASARANEISGEAKNYITDNLSTQVLANSNALGVITTQFGTFYDKAIAAAWYGLTVKTGELISGFTVSGVDKDTTTPGTAGSVFAISANTFTVGKAKEDISDPAELAYVNAKGLPYGTMYDAVTNKVIPAFMVEWTGTKYNIFFNGRTEFSNYLSPGTTTIDGGYISTGSITTGKLAIGAGIVNGYIQSSNFATVGGAGFRLKSDAAGTSADPTIYGAYIRGGTIAGTLITGASALIDLITANYLPTYASLTQTYGVTAYYTNSVSIMTGIWTSNAGLASDYTKFRIMDHSRIIAPVNLNLSVAFYPSDASINIVTLTVSIKINGVVHGSATSPPLPWNTGLHILTVCGLVFEVRDASTGSDRSITKGNGTLNLNPQVEGEIEVYLSAVTSNGVFVAFDRYNFSITASQTRTSLINSY